MQTHGGEAATAAIESRERQFSVRLTVDFERNGEPVDVSDLVDNISTDRMMKGSAPEEIMLVEGSSAAELKFDLSGSCTDSLRSLCSPRSTDSRRSTTTLPLVPRLSMNWVLRLS